MELVRQSAGIVLVFLLLGLAVWSLKRRSGTPSFGGKWQGKPRNLECIERLTISPQHSLHLVRINGHTFVLGVSPGGISVLQGASGATPQTDVPESPKND